MARSASLAGGMDSYRKAPGRLLVVLLASALAGAGCSAPERVDPRREQLRDRLRASLGDRYDAPLPAGTIEEIQRGARLYDTLCRACHGPTGNGNGESARVLTIQPADLTDPTTASFFSDQAKLKIIAEGIAETPMIGWSRMLEDNEQIALLHFMNTLVRESQTP